MALKVDVKKRLKSFFVFELVGLLKEKIVIDKNSFMIN